jgi:CDP-diacylglycerol--glycerol-3-phosphate 3-phosphatidyltransferase
MATRARASDATRARLLFAGATALVGAATWLVLEVGTGWAGAAAGGSGALILAGAALAGRGGSARERMLGSAVDRAFDGCVLAAVAWVTREPDPAISAGALLALAAGFLAAYVRARGQSLGYQVEESPVTRALRYAAVSLGLATGELGAGVYAAAGIAILTALVRASQVAKEERA